MARLEHVNITVADPDATAAELCALFDWQVRWAGAGMTTGRTVHVGVADSYVALFSHGRVQAPADDSYYTCGAMNHLAVVVEDLGVIEARVKAAGYAPGNHADYEPGRRFYFHDRNGIEIEVVSYGAN